MRSHQCLVLSLLLTLVSFGASDILDGDVGVDRPYGDLPQQPSQLPPGTEARVCATMCTTNALCVAWAFVPANCTGNNIPLCYLKANITGQVWNACRVSGVKGDTLVPLMYKPLPLGHIIPDGWLWNELQIQANGLSGHLALFWGDIMNSSWIGGPDDGGLHERVPYWLNGVVPLAVLLNDKDLLKQVDNYITYIIQNQQPNGWLGPVDSNDPWARFPLLLAFWQYYEATKEPWVLKSIFAFLHCLQQQLFVYPLPDWAAARWQDLVLTIQWLYDNYPNGEEQFLLDMMELAHDQGMDWNSWFGPGFPEGEVMNNFTLWTHGVNNGQAIKSAAVNWRHSQDPADLDSTVERVAKLDMYHGAASGVFNCDEHLAGLMPSHGTELCTVVEIMFSHEILFSILGDPSYAERAETVAYNALPATFYDEMWAHQYLQQTNEINSMHTEPYLWITDGPDSTIYGLEPNYGCCTANFNQGWPKFVTHMVFQVPATPNAPAGLVMAMYGPILVQTQLDDGNHVSMLVTTNYPFDDSATLSIESQFAMSLLLRIPSWSDSATVSLNGATPLMAASGTLYPLVLPAGANVVVLNFSMVFYTQEHVNNSVSIHRGPLLYGLSIPGNYSIITQYSFQSADWQVLPVSPWNYALVLDPNNLNDYLIFNPLVNNTVGYDPYSTGGAPVSVTAKGRLLPAWQAVTNAAGTPPTSPVETDEPVEELTLLPFGSTKLRIAATPYCLN